MITYKRNTAQNTINQKLQTSSCASRNFKQYYKKKHDSNDVVIACHLNIQTSYLKRKTTTNRCFQTKHNTRQKIRHTNKQQTANKYLICNKIQAKEKHDIPHTSGQKLLTGSCATWKFKQYYGKNNDTNRRVILCNMKTQTRD